MRRVLVETYLRSLRKDDDGTDGIYRCLEFCMFETDCWARAGVSVRLGPIAEQIICGSLSPDMSGYEPYLPIVSLPEPAERHLWGNTHARQNACYDLPSAELNTMTLCLPHSSIRLVQSLPSRLPHYPFQAVAFGTIVIASGDKLIMASHALYHNELCYRLKRYKIL